MIMDTGIILMEVKAKSFHLLRFEWAPSAPIASALGTVTGILSFPAFMWLAWGVTGMYSPGFRNIMDIWGIFMQSKVKPFHRFRFKWTPSAPIASAFGTVTNIYYLSTSMYLTTCITGMD
jgi:hypothetical protein